MKLRAHWWGIQVGNLSVIWYDIWAGGVCWQMSRHHENSSTHIPTGTGWPS